MAARITPSKGGKPDKLMRDALMVALNREAVDADGQKTKKLNIIAAKLVELAASALLPQVTFPAVVVEAVLPSAGPGAVRTAPT